MSGSAKASTLRSLTLLQAQQLAGTLTVFAAFIAAAASGEVGSVYCGLFVLALLVATWARGRFAHQHSAVWTVLLAGVLVVFMLQVFTGVLDIVLAAARFALLLCAHRLWNRKTERDELLLLLLSLLLLCAGAALSAELLFGLAFALYAVAGTWALALTHLRFRIEESRAESAPAMLHSRRLITPQMLGALGGLSLIALCGAAVLFFVFPRVTIGGFHRLAHPHAIAGLSDSIELGGQGTIDDDPRVALRATLVPDDGAQEIAIHWRARALEVWTGRGWHARPGPVTPIFPRVPFIAPHGNSPRVKWHWQNAELELLAAFNEGVLLTPEGSTTSIHFPEPLTARPSNKHALVNAAGDFVYQPVETGDLRYQVSTAKVDSPLAENEDSPLKRNSEVLLDSQPPANLSPRIRQLGEKLAKGKHSREAAQAVLNYLGNGFSYTRVLEDGGDDPIGDFLFRRRAGHCELFSSAMVLLLRAGGIPARNITGYYGGVRMPGGYYAIRSGDAHSWVEVWEDGIGWVLWDPTPAADRGSKEDGLWARTLLVWDGVEAKWLSTIVEFDLLSQARALSEAGRIISEAGRRLSGRSAGSKEKIPLKRLLFGGMVALITIFASWFLRRKLRARGSPGALLRPEQLRARSLWRNARAVLIDAGANLPESLTPREAARAAADQLGPSAAPLSTIVEKVNAARWGEAGLDAGEATALLQNLKRALREARA